VNWWILRPVLDQRWPCTLVEVRDHWTLGDMLEAHLALDALDIAEEERAQE